MLERLKQNIAAALRQVLDEHHTPPESVPLDVEFQPEKQFGDWSISAAMKLARVWRKPPLVIAQTLASGIEQKLDQETRAFVERFEVKPPGYINIFLKTVAWHELIKDVLRRGADFGRGPGIHRERILLEFVSANPTGPLSIAHARQAAVGESLANILTFSGRDVTREYYINDEGNQITNLGLSLRARYLERLGRDPGSFPADGYQGAYLYDLADRLIKEHGDEFASRAADDAAARKFFSTYANDAILSIIKDELQAFGVTFDSWFSQKALSERGDIPQVLEELRQKGHSYEQDGATWLRSTAFGDDKDRVLIKSDGLHTYITPDIAYHKDKFTRGFDRIINIWGPDHHGYINRLKAAVSALGYDRERVIVLIIQLATLFRNGQPVVMSTRAGEYVSLQELMQEVGKDAARFFLAMRKCDSQLEFDLELAKQQSLDNPVYYIQYAHARIAGIRKLRHERWGAAAPAADLSLLVAGEEIDLMRSLSRFPEIVEECSRHLEPVGLTVYLRELAGLFHAFYNKCRVITDDRELSLARVSMVEAVQQVIANGLRLLGVSAVEKM